MSTSKKKQIQLPLALRIIRWLFPKVEVIAPKLAERWFVKLFFSPFRYPVPAKERSFLEKAKTSTLRHKKRQVVVYEWGEGKPVLFVHGWMGRAGQFKQFVDFYTAKGYKCITFDAPAHGFSEGKQSNVIEFSEVIQQLSDKFGCFEMIVGHSLGGVATLYANVVQKLTAKMVMIGSPGIADEILTEFQSKINASSKNIPYLLTYVRKAVGLDFHSIEARKHIRNLQGVDLLIIHDKNDSQVSVKSALEIHDASEGGKLVLTEGLGHNRTLKAREVIAATYEHLCKANLVEEDVIAYR